MISWIKLQFHSLWTKPIILVITLLTCLYIGYGFYLLSFDISYGYVDGFRVLYQTQFLTESMALLDFLFMLTCTFLYYVAFSKQADRFCLFLISDTPSRKTYFISKLLVLWGLSLGFLLCQTSLLVSISLFTRPFIYLIKDLIQIIGLIYSRGQLFGLLCLVMIQLINHVFVLIIPVFLYWLISLVERTNQVYQTLKWILPSLTSYHDYPSSTFPFLFYLSLIILFLLGFYLFLLTDIRT